MTKPIIAIEVDDVLAHSTESLRQVVNAKTGAQLQPEHFQVPGPYWGYYERLWENHGLADKVTMEELSPQMAKDQSHVPVYLGASKALKSLAKSFELIIVTARNSEWEKATHVWLDSNFPGMFTKVVFGGGKYHDENITKGDLCAKIGASYLIDDNVEHCISAADREITPILFGRYGWHVDVPEDMIRCKTWKEVERYFDAAQRH